MPTAPKKKSPLHGAVDFIEVFRPHAAFYLIMLFLSLTFGLFAHHQPRTGHVK